MTADRLQATTSFRRLIIVLGCVSLAIWLSGTDRSQAQTSDEWSGTVVLTGDQTVSPDQILRFDPWRDTTVEISGNLVVEGVLEMKPTPGVEHVLRFTGVDEAAFVGGGMTVLSTDRGLWVVGGGRLDIVGAERAGWNRTGGDLSWESSDELVVSPTAQGDFGAGGFESFDAGDPVPRAASELPAAEVLNLTRTVSIEGTPGHRAHVIILSSAPQTIRFAELRHLGPRQLGADGHTVGVLGRYPLHFHMTGDGSRGSVVEGNVVRQSGHRAYVIHAANGVTLHDNIAYDVYDTPYWWDRGVEHASHDNVWEHNFAGLVKVDPVFRGYTMSGFDLGRGDGNVANGNAAAGIQGNKNCSGFHWPSQGSGLWEFRHNVAHNNNCHGIFVWQNSSANHLIENFVAYRNGVAGVNHGAYTNDYVYDNLLLFENAHFGVVSHAFSHEPRHGNSSQTWSCVTVVGSPVALQIAPSNAKSEVVPAIFENFVAVDTAELYEVTEAALAKGQTIDERVDFEQLNVRCSAFVDDDGNVHEGMIDTLAADGITAGCNPPVFDLYCPHREVSRGEMAAFLGRALDLPSTVLDFFVDAEASIFEEDINRLAAAGITNGCNPPANDEFCPDESINREQMAAFLVRAFELTGSASDLFTDDDGSIFESDIDILGASGVTKGCNPPANDLFCPRQPVLRDQMASFLGRALGYDPVPIW